MKINRREHRKNCHAERRTDARLGRDYRERRNPDSLLLARVAVKEGLPAAMYEQFEIELKEQRKPSSEVDSIPLRMIL